jgi:hypothetical protein
MLLRHLQTRVDHQRTAINKICIGARTVPHQSGVGGLPRSVTPLLTLAMNIPTRSAIRQMPASLRNCGSRSPAAPRSSKKPVMQTISSGREKYGGIIRARSCLILLKWAVAVKTNITTKAYRAESGHEARACTPAAPMPRKANHDTRSTIRTSIGSSTLSGRDRGACHIIF